MAKRGVDAGLFFQMLERAETQRFGSEKPYEPCMRATGGEGPSSSTLAPVPSRRLGRDVHVLSRTEKANACLALYHPKVFALHEQRLLSPAKAPNPLQGHPGAAGRQLKPLPGTVEVAVRLGLSDIIPTVEIPDPNDRTRSIVAPFPWFGDLLVFLDYEDPYAVNWNAKRDRKGYSSPKVSRRQVARRAAAMRRDVGRIQIEAALYRDAGIATIETCLADFPAHVEPNLVGLAAQHNVNHGLSEDIFEHLATMLRRSMGSRATPLDVFTSIVTRYGLSMGQCNTAMKHAIFERRLRVDLFKPILPDRPLNTERVDLLDHFAERFRRP